uniref:ATP synthase complex subunit 8 n=1 Tax=Chrysotus sp. TaxID=2908774 RepID=A0A977TPS4_9MUSC|nr:ATP synthase F0 subunit 8 [Chrysotus sp.]
MPQMAPLSWLSLYIIFTITFIVFCILNYYVNIPMSPSHSTKMMKSTNTLNWKW